MLILGLTILLDSTHAGTILEQLTTIKFTLLMMLIQKYLTLEQMSGPSGLNQIVLMAYIAVS